MWNVVPIETSVWFCGPLAVSRHHYFHLVALVFASASCMGPECSSGRCAILQSRFTGATFNLFPSVLCRTTTSIIVCVSYSLYASVSGFHLASVFSYYRYPVVVCSTLAFRALTYIIHACYCFLPRIFSLCITFYSTLFSFPLFIFPL